MKDTLLLGAMGISFFVLLVKISQFFLAAFSMATPLSPSSLNLTTIAANMQKESTLECWQLAAPFLSSTTAGTLGASFAQLGEAGAASYTVIPAEFDGGLHTAPAVQ